MGTWRAAAIGVGGAHVAGEDGVGLAFLGSAAYIIGMLASAAFGLFPYVLPATTGASNGLTLWNTAAASYGLGVGLVWFIPGMLLVACYSVFIYRHFAGKVGLEEVSY